jgi:adenosylhomocysteine nucleosidase
VHYGTIGSGDVWTKDAEEIKEFNEKYVTLCEEMESAAIYEVAQKFEIPVASIRVISNNEIIGEEYIRETGAVAQKFLLEILK